MAYNKIVSDNYDLWIKSPEGMKLYLHSEAPSASTALGNISGLRQFMTPQEIGHNVSETTSIFIVYYLFVNLLLLSDIVTYPLSQNQNL